MSVTLARAAGQALRVHPWSCLVLAAAATTSLWLGYRALVQVLVVSVGIGVAGWARFPQAFDTLVGRRARAGWRREMVYGRRWRAATAALGLDTCSRRDRLHEITPAGRHGDLERRAQLGSVRCRADGDVVNVRIAPSHRVEDWAQRADALAREFAAARCLVGAGRRGDWIKLVFIRPDAPTLADDPPGDRARG